MKAAANYKRLANKSFHSSDHFEWSDEFGESTVSEGLLILQGLVNFST